MRGDRSTTFTDGGGRRWRVREIIRPDATAHEAIGRVPALTHATLVFESRGERRFASGAPLDWREDRRMLGDLFARATRTPIPGGDSADQSASGMCDADRPSYAMLRAESTERADGNHGYRGES